MFLRGGECCGVLMKHRRTVKNGEQVIPVEMAQQLKPKKINVVPGQLFCGQCKEKYLLDTDSHIDNQDKVQLVTDTDNEFTECQTPRKKLQSIDISPVSLHAFMETLKGDISEVYSSLFEN